jgi:hypothetical protein
MKYTEKQILHAIENSYEHNQFNERYFWSKLKEIKNESK